MRRTGAERLRAGPPRSTACALLPHTCRHAGRAWSTTSCPDAPPRPASPPWLASSSGSCRRCALPACACAVCARCFACMAPPPAWHILAHTHIHTVASQPSPVARQLPVALFLSTRRSWAPTHPACSAQLPEEALLPAYRGDPLQRLCSLCDSCCEPGHPKDHLAPATADCRVCAQHRKTVGAGCPSQAWLSPLVSLGAAASVARCNQAGDRCRPRASRTCPQVKGASHYHHGCASLTGAAVLRQPASCSPRGCSGAACTPAMFAHYPPSLISPASQRWSGSWRRV